MCDPVTAGILLTGAAGGAKVINTNQALKRQDRQAAAGIRRQGEKQREANTEVSKLIEEIGANRGEAEKADALAAFQNILREGRDDTESSLPITGAASDRFVEDVGAAKRSVRGQGGEAAERLAVIDGILRQRVNEGQRVGRTESQLNKIRGDIAAEDFLTQLRVAAERPNVFIDALASVGQGVGSALAVPALKLPTKAPINPNTIVDPLMNPANTVFG